MSGMFQNCANLTTVDLSKFTTNKVTSMYSMFTGCKELTGLPEGFTIPEGVTSIGNYAFFYCTALKSVSIPSSVKTIGKSAFQNCKSLKSITIKRILAVILDVLNDFISALSSVYDFHVF